MERVRRKSDLRELEEIGKFLLRTLGVVIVIALIIGGGVWMAYSVL